MGDYQNVGQESGSVGPPGSSGDFRNVLTRLATFASFPTSSSPVFPSPLAEAGFYYTGPGDRVRCHRCDVTHEGWQAGDRPEAVHTRISPNCPHVRRETGNTSPCSSHSSSPVQASRLHSDSVSSIEDCGYGSDAPECSFGINSQRSVSSAELPPGPTFVSPIVQPSGAAVNTPVGVADSSSFGSVEEDARWPTGHSFRPVQAECQQTSGYGIGRPSSQISASASSAAGPEATVRVPNFQAPHAQSTNGHQIFISSMNNLHLHTGISMEEANRYFQAQNSAGNVQTSMTATQPRDEATAQGRQRQRASVQDEDDTRQAATCQVCRQEPVNVIFIPCRHLVTCAGCAVNMRRCISCDAHINRTSEIAFF